MDEFNNEKNPFDEQTGGDTMPNTDYNPYGAPREQQGNPYMQSADPYNQQNPQNPYQQQNQNPYNQQMQQNPYQQTNQGYTYNQQNIPQQGYVNPQGYAQGYQPYPRPQSTGMAAASLVLGIISIVCALFTMAFPVLFLVPIIGLILGIVFKCKHLPVGKGMSTAGIITSAIGIVIPIAVIALMVVLLLTNGAQIMEFVKEYSPEQYEELYDLYGDQFPQWFEGILRILGR